MTRSLHGRLLDILQDERRVTESEAILDQHGTDFSIHPRRRPDIVVFPRTTAEISKVLAFANANMIPVVPVGAGTSLEGHVIPTCGGISLNLSQMARIVEICPSDLTAIVEAGVTRTALNQQAGEHGLFFPIDPGADATLGGMAATNASGTTTVRYGSMLAQVLALEVVLANGAVIRPGTRVRKSAAGYNLAAFFVGSEGTLGVITELTLRLYGIPESTVAARAVFSDIEDACRAATAIATLITSAVRIELLDGWTIRAINAYEGSAYREAATLFLELGGSAPAVEADLGLVAEFVEAEGCSELLVERDPTARAKLWRARHHAAYALMATAPGKKSKSTDVCVPLSELAAALRHARRLVEQLGIDACIAGHVGDGNFHVAFMVDPHDPTEVERARRLDAEIVADALARNGTCTGEHGIGLGKITHLSAEHPDLVPWMWKLKEVFDPNGILNPGKVIPPRDDSDDFLTHAGGKSTS